jgi:hypothetical protein
MIPLKIRRLPETDLARIAPMQRDAKRRSLQRQSTGFSSITYDPVRSQTLDIYNATPPLFADTTDTDWATIESLIRKAGRSEDERETNVTVGSLLYKFIRERGITAAHRDHGRFSTRIGDAVRYWDNAVLIDGDDLLIPFPDYRRSFTLGAEGRRFAASVMHHRIRAQNPTELGQAKLAVFTFPQVANSGERLARMVAVPDAELYSADELASMIAETYDLWAEVLAERAQEARRSGTTGGLL